MSKVYSIKTVQILPISLDQAWDFFSSPANLKEITPDELGFNIISKHHGEKMYPGQIIEYKVSPVLNIPIYWMTEITHVEDKKFFVDEQQTPIEDASVNWTVPFVPLARLRLAVAGVRAEIASAVEAAHFDPWGGLMAHRPLGDVMRARKVAYFRSQNQRK
jgi:hypothetical protein